MLIRVNEGINLKCVGLASSDEAHPSKVVKLFNIGYPVRLLDLHRSDPFIMRNGGFKLDEEDVPDGWYVIMTQLDDRRTYL